MRLKPYDTREGYRVWLSQDDLDLLIETPGPNTHKVEQRIAKKFGGRAALRRNEASEVASIDVVGPMDDKRLRVWEDAAKRNKYRETPISHQLATEIETLSEMQGYDPDQPVLDVEAKTLYRWVKRSAEKLYADTGDEGWRYVDFHDLRRTAGTYMLECGVLPSVVMSHMGIESWTVFRKHYLGEFSPEALRRERGKVPYLTPGGSPNVDVDDPQAHLVPVASPVTQHYSGGDNAF